MEAELIENNGNEVVFRLANGKTATFPVSRLSEADQEFLRQQVPAAKPPPSEAPGDPGSGAEAAPNFDLPWPKSAGVEKSVKSVTIEEDSAAKRFVYESTNYRFVSNVKLNQRVAHDLAVLFEATYAYCRSLPLGLTADARTEGKLHVVLYETTAEYEKAEGVPGTRGCFVRNEDYVQLDLQAMGVSPDSRGLEYNALNASIPHELTHQLTHLGYYAKGAGGWFSEGIADYVKTTPYQDGTFKTRDCLKVIPPYIHGSGLDGKGGITLGSSPEVPALETFFMKDPSTFPGDQANTNYGLSLALVTYFLHFEGKKDGARLKEFLKTLRNGKEGAEALEVLLNGRSYEELQEDFAKAWKREGIEFKFKKAG